MNVRNIKETIELQVTGTELELNQMLNEIKHLIFLKSLLKETFSDDELIYKGCTFLSLNEIDLASYTALEKFGKALESAIL